MATTTGNHQQGPALPAILTGPQLIALHQLTAGTAPEQLRKRARLAWRSSLPRDGSFWARFRARALGLGIDVIDAATAEGMMASRCPGETVILLPEPEPAGAWPEGLALCWCSTARAAIRRGD